MSAPFTNIMFRWCNALLFAWRHKHDVNFRNMFNTGIICKTMSELNIQNISEWNN